MKKKAIISLEKLSIKQRKQLEEDFPNGFLGHIKSLKTPNGDIDALEWETDEITYLVKVNKASLLSLLEDEDNDDDDFIEGESDDDIELDEDEEDFD